MASLINVRQALANVLGGISGLRVSPIFLANPTPPAAVIMPQPRQGLRFDALGGSVSYLMRIVLLGSYTEDASSQNLMDGYLASTGATSIAAIIAANPTLGGVVDNCNMDTVNGYGLMDWAGQQYLGTQVLLTVMAQTP